MFSVRDVQTKKVIGYVTTFLLFNAKCVVQKAGRMRVRKEKKKNVHAWVKGHFIDSEPYNYEREFPVCRVPIKYSPYENESFIISEGEVPIDGACHVHGFVKDGSPKLFADPW